MTELEETHNQIIAMWNNGMTSGEIARAMGVTRNVVIGRVTRLREKGIELRAAPKAAPKLQKVVKREVKTQRGWILKKQVKPKNAPDISFEQLFFDLPMPVRRIDIMQLQPHSCRYIIDRDPKRGALYCGDTKHYRSYCKKHANLCYVPARAIV